MIVRKLVALLGYKVDDKGLKKFNKGLETTKGQLGSMKAAALAAGAALVGVVTGTMVRSVFQANAEYQKLSAQLATLEGSAAKGAEAFKKLQGIASTTPFSLNEVSRAYIRLKGAGFDASEGNIRALGDMSVASGKSMDDMVEAMLSANRGLGGMVDNFIGLSAKAKDGNLVLKNTRTGVESIVKAGDTKGLMSFFVAAGKAEGITGGMARQMETLGGKMSNLKDNIFKFMIAVGDNGVRAAFTELLTLMAAQVEGGGSLAELLGGVLAKGIRTVTKIIEFAIANWKTISAAVVTFGTVIAAIKMAAFIAGMASLKATLAGLLIAAAPVLVVLAKFVIPIGLAIAAVVALSLVLEDLFYFFTGGESAIGSFIDKFKSQQGPLGEVARFIESALAGLKGLILFLTGAGTEMLTAIQPELNELKAFVLSVWTDIKDGFSQAMNDLFGDADSGADGVTQAFGLIKSFVTEIFPFIVGYAKFHLKSIIVMWGLLWTGAKISLTLLWNYWKFMWNALAPPAIALAGLIVQHVQGMWHAFKVILILLHDAWVALWALMEPIVTPIIQAISEKFSLFVENLKLIWGSIMEFLSPVFAFISEQWDSMVNGMIATLQMWVDLVKTGASLLGGLVGANVGGEGIMSGIKSKLGSVSARASEPGFAGLTSGQVAGPAVAGAAGAMTQNATATVGQVNINVTQSPASPGDIAAAAQTGVNKGMQDTLSDARSNLAGGAA